MKKQRLNPAPHREPCACETLHSLARGARRVGAPSGWMGGWNWECAIEMRRIGREEENKDHNNRPSSIPALPPLSTRRRRGRTPSTAPSGERAALSSQRDHVRTAMRATCILLACMTAEATRRSQAPRSNRCGSRITTSSPSLPGNLPMRHSKEWQIDLGSQGHGELALVRTVRIHTRTRTSAQPAIEHFSGLHSDRDRPLLHRATARAGYLHAWRPSELRLLH